MKPIVVIAIGVVALGLASAAIFPTYRSISNERIRMRWAYRLNQGENTVTATLPQGTYMIEVTELPDLNPGTGLEKYAKLPVSITVKSKDAVISGPVIGPKLTFTISKAAEFLPLEMVVVLTDPKESPTFLSFGPTK